MDGTSFDRMVYRITAVSSRRNLLRSAFAAGVAGLGAGSLLGGDDAEATGSCKQKHSGETRKECKRTCKNICHPKSPEAPCQKDSECCPKKTKYTCGVSHNSGVDNVCCGTHGATCSTTFQCCLGFNCEGDQCVPMGV